MKRTAIFSIFLIVFGLSITWETAMGTTSRDDSASVLAILPFEANAKDDISYITEGILRMLHSRLSWQDNVKVMNQNHIKTVVGDSKKTAGRETISRVSKSTQADYVIAGIITEFAGAFSIDTKVYDIKDGSYLTFYGQSETVDQIIPQVDIVAAKINKKVFDRTTVSYEKFKKENIITEEELKRMNPERMMPVGRPLDTEEEKPWWKIW